MWKDYKNVTTLAKYLQNRTGEDIMIPASSVLSGTLIKTFSGERTSGDKSTLQPCNIYYSIVTYEAKVLTG